MKWLNDYRVRLVLVGVVAAIIFGGGSAKADFIFGTPINLGPVVNSPYSDFTEWISADELSLFFSSNREPGGYQDFDLWVTTRQTKSEDWGIPIHLGDNFNSRQN